jgi:hypothetical protein
MVKLIVWSGKMLLVLASIVNLGFESRGEFMTILLFFPRLLRVLKWGHLFDERRGLTTTGHWG